MRSRFLISLLAVAAMASAATDALAAGPQRNTAAPVAKDRAEELFEQGTAAFDAGRFVEAEAKFEQAWTIKQTHDIAGNLGIVKRQLGKHREAAQHISWALQHLPPSEGSSTRKGLEQELQKARGEVSVLRVQVNVAGASVTINGRDVGQSPIAGDVFADAGAVTVVARREGYRAAQASLTVTKGESREVSLVLERASTPAERRSLVPGIVLGSLAGVALATGIGVFAAGRGKTSTAQELHDGILDRGVGCVSGAPRQDSACTELYDTASAGNTMQKAGVGLMIGGGAAAVATVIYFVLPQPKPSAASGALRVMPTLLPNNAGVAFSGTF